MEIQDHERQRDPFSELEDTSSSKARGTAGIARASWRGILSLNVPTLGLGAVEYHLRAAKAHGDLEPVRVAKFDTATGREVVPRETVRLYKYKTNERGERESLSEIPHDDAKQKLRFDNEFQVTARNERRYFVKDDLEAKGVWTEVPPERIADKQIDGDTGEEVEIEPFDRTSKIEVERDGFVSLERLPEYKFKEVYQLGPDTDKKVKETAERVRQLARYLLDKQTALVSFFSWGRGYQYYTAVLYPYERKDGKLWLLMGLSQGILKLDDSWSLQPLSKEAQEAQEVAPVPTVRKKNKPKVSISK